MMEIVKFRPWIRVIAGLLLCATQALSADSVLPSQVSLSSYQVVDGAVILITAQFPAAPDLGSAIDLSGTFEETHFSFYRNSQAGAGIYQALVGVPHGHKAGKAVIHLATSSDANFKDLEFQILDAKYASETLKVSPGKAHPKKKDMNQIQRDISDVSKIYSHYTEIKGWKGKFIYPVENQVTSIYGTNRVFNGDVQSFHNGLDLKAPMKTPVHASAAGTIALAHSLFFTGNTVLIDHGFGVVTLYAHMSELKVKQGDHVEAGDLIGLSGMTGRANGPHLHFGFIINKVKVNPIEALKVIQ